MDALELLANDHRVAQSQFSRYEFMTTHGDRRDVALAVVDELTRHMVVERHMLYPLLARIADPVDRLPRHSDVHDKMLPALVVLPQMVTHDPSATDDLIATLQEDLAFHTRIDEQHVHPRLRRAFDQPALDELGQLLEQAKGIVPGRATPGVLADQPTNLAIATATFCDRLRDRLGDQAPI